MGKSLNESELTHLTKGQVLKIVFLNGDVKSIHPAKFIEIKNNQAHLLIYFTDKPQRKIRWSILTNKPVGEFANFAGKVWIEQDD